MRIKNVAKANARDHRCSAQISRCPFRRPRNTRVQSTATSTNPSPSQVEPGFSPWFDKSIADPMSPVILRQDQRSFFYCDRRNMRLPKYKITDDQRLHNSRSRRRWSAFHLQNHHRAKNTQRAGDRKGLRILSALLKEKLGDARGWWCLRSVPIYPPRPLSSYSRSHRTPLRWAIRGTSPVVVVMVLVMRTTWRFWTGDASHNTSSDVKPSTDPLRLSRDASPDALQLIQPDEIEPGRDEVGG